MSVGATGRSFGGQRLDDAARHTLADDVEGLRAQLCTIA